MSCVLLDIVRQQAANHGMAHAALNETLEYRCILALKHTTQKTVRYKIIQQFRAVGGASVGGLWWLLHTLVPAPSQEDLSPLSLLL